MKEIRIHGRGGQGAAVASRILTTAFVYEGKWACGFPVFGFERRGAPLAAFVRFDDKQIREKTRVYTPDCLIVIDSHLFDSSSTFQGLKEEGLLAVNAPEAIAVQPHKNLRIVGSVDATGILDILTLECPKECQLMIKIDDPKDTDTLNAIVALIEKECEE